MTYTVNLATYSDYETDDTDERKQAVTAKVDALVDELVALGMSVTGSLGGHGVDKSYSVALGS